MTRRSFWLAPHDPRLLGPTTSSQVATMTVLLVAWSLTHQGALTAAEATGGSAPTQQLVTCPGMLANGSTTSTDPPGASGRTNTAGGEQGTTDALRLAMTVSLVALSALFAGLTIGVMGLDTVTLEIISEAGADPDAGYAKALLPVRSLGHQALCTLVLGNMWCNVMIATLFADVGDSSSGGGGGGWGAVLGFLLSTFIILIFTEILPMSICKSKYALRVAAAGVPLLRVFLVLLYPVAKPLGMLLDALLHHDPGQIYDRNELKRLMIVHCEDHAAASGLEASLLNLLVGAIDFQQTQICTVMTPISKVVMLHCDRVVDAALLHEIFQCGHSRLPVYRILQDSFSTSAASPSATGEGATTALSSPPASPAAASPAVPLHQREIIGLVYTKDILHVTPEIQVTVKDLMSRTMVQTVNEHAKLDAMLKCFRSGRAHLAVVTNVWTLPNGDRSYVNVGIVTLEDVVEKLIQGDILDEYDRIEMEQQSAKRGRESGKDNSPLLSRSGNAARATATVVPMGDPSGRLVIPRPRVHFNSYAVTPAHAVSPPPLSREQIYAAAYYMSDTIDAFAYWSADRIVNLIEKCTIKCVFPPDDIGKAPLADIERSIHHGPHHRRGSVATQTTAAQGRYRDCVLYVTGRSSSSFTLILGGTVTVVASREKLRSQLHSWRSVGGASLSLAGPPVFTPNFTAFVSRPSRLLVITAEQFREEARIAHAASAMPNDSDSNLGSAVLSGRNSPTLERQESSGAAGAGTIMLQEDPRGYDDDEQLPVTTSLAALESDPPDSNGAGGDPTTQRGGGLFRSFSALTAAASPPPTGGLDALSEQSPQPERHNVN